MHPSQSIKTSDIERITNAVRKKTAARYILAEKGVEAVVRKLANSISPIHEILKNKL
jgi:hypothetical protein